MIKCAFDVSENPKNDNIVDRAGGVHELTNHTLWIYSMILDSMQVKREILKVAPLEVGRGDLHAGGFGVLMMFDLYF